MSAPTRNPEIRQVPDTVDPAAIDALARGMHGDPFALLGPHRTGAGRVVRTMQPQAREVQLLNRTGEPVAKLERVHPAGIFVAPLPARLRSYRFRITPWEGKTYDSDDPYRFGSSLGDLDLHLLREGSHELIHEALGARQICLRGVRGTRFAVWAPNARRVSVIGGFNDWDGRRHIMRLHPGNGLWEIFIPGIGNGERYKYELIDSNGKLLPLKSDPLARFCEGPPGNASIVYESRYRWRDSKWLTQRSTDPQLDQPMAIYEVHLGSWRRIPEEGDRYLTYRELADELVPYVSDLGYTHIELLPVTEHPFDGSWGYQPIGLYAPTQRFGTPDDFRYFVDRCHQAGIGVIVDWVPAHFPRDEHGLRSFDGTALYEHADPRKGEHADWGTLIFNYGRNEVINYLIGSALCWITEFHIDGLRVDAVASMLYLDYSREPGEWVPNKYGGNENLEAVAFLRELNKAIHRYGAISLAEESTAWPGVSRPVYSGGLGFTYKWNMGWMNDTLSYMRENPVHRKHHHDKMTFGLVYAFNENFILPLSHDEVVHGKSSLLGRMPGDEWQRFANLRAYFTFMYGHPGKKLLFMGGEFAQSSEWNHDSSLDWHLLQYPVHAGVQMLVRDLNDLYRRHPALYQEDFQPGGFEWLDWNDRDNSIFSWLRRGHAGEVIACVVNFTPVPRQDYRLGLPANGSWRIALNSDAGRYGGSDNLDAEIIEAQADPCQNQPFSITITLPPLAALILEPAGQRC
jgi:1,4-alpha-glucan branching enzyme